MSSLGRLVEFASMRTPAPGPQVDGWGGRGQLAIH